MTKKQSSGPKYTPSEGVKRRIAKWEGSSMWKAASDTGKVNRSFNKEAVDFYNAIPKEVLGYLHQDALDALFSYSYNVGAGNFKKRVANSLVGLKKAIVSRKGLDTAINRVMSSMYATKDKELRGLNNRRAFEKAAFKQGIYSMLAADTNRVNWEMDETKVDGYKSLADWYSEDPNRAIANADIRREDDYVGQQVRDIIYGSLGDYYNNYSPRITRINTIPQQKVTSAVSALMPTELADSKPTGVTESVEEYKPSLQEALAFFESTSPQVRFSSKNPDMPIIG